MRGRLVYALGPDGTHHDRLGVDCPQCSQAVRVDLHGGRLSLRCFAGCREQDVADGVDVPRVVAELHVRAAA